MNMHTNPSYIPESVKTQNANTETIDISEVIRWLDGVRNGPMNSKLLSEITNAETDLLQLKWEWIEYVSGAYLFMIQNLKNKWSIPLTDITQVFMSA
jgi:hypothetical protein